MQGFWDVTLCAVSSVLKNPTNFIFRDKQFHSCVISGFHCEADNILILLDQEILLEQDLLTLKDESGTLS